MKREATYLLLSGEWVTVEYDSNDPCDICGLPVICASTSGSTICPWCDCGIYRDGTKWTIEDLDSGRVREKAKAHGGENDPRI